jgi:hypoxanthine phosphoribosyltransferase
MASKQYITPEQLRFDSYILAARVADSKFQPDFVVAVWRGGAPIGCYVHEFFKRIGQKPDHIAIRTSRYTGIDESTDAVQVWNLGYLLERVNRDSKILLVDDVSDRGLTDLAIRQTLLNNLKEDCPKDIRSAVVYYKPTRSKTGIKPNYYIHETDQWIVFPHELEGMSLEEIAEHIHPDIAIMVKVYSPEYDNWVQDLLEKSKTK